MKILKQLEFCLNNHNPNDGRTILRDSNILPISGHTFWAGSGSSKVGINQNLEPKFFAPSPPLSFIKDSTAKHGTILCQGYKPKWSLLVFTGLCLVWQEGTGYMGTTDKGDRFQTYGKLHNGTIRLIRCKGPKTGTPLSIYGRNLAQTILNKTLLLLL